MKNIIKKIIIAILTLEAKFVLKKYKPKIIAVTGSVGKTSTKDAIYTALLPFFHVRKSSKSFNSDFGIPLSILGLGNAWSDMRGWTANIVQGFLLVVKKTDYPEWLILEIGADHPGEIEEVMKWIHPEISVITRIGDVPVHVEHYKSVKDVVKEKSFLAKGVKNDGFLVLNSDDDEVMAFKEYSKARLVTFGVNHDADIKASYLQPVYDESGHVSGVSFKVDIKGSSIPITLSNILGASHVYPVLASFAIVNALELNMLKAGDSFKNHDYPRGRMNIISGMNDSTIIDDTYNASPVAMEEGFRSVETLEVKGRKVAALGDMLELGKHSEEEHRRLGEFAGKIFSDVITVGIRAREMKESILKSGFTEEHIHCFDTSVEAGDFLKKFIKNDDLLYVKGSQGMRMERVVERVMRNPKEKAKLLVRQETEWVKKG